MNYLKLMNLNPTALLDLGTFTNSLGQVIDFYEHPLRGDECEIICVCHELEKAHISDFFDLGDMVAEHGEYEPLFILGKYFTHGKPTAEQMEDYGQRNAESLHP